MGATTSINGLPYPIATVDAPNGPLQIQNLATQLDTRLVPRFPTAAARDVAIPTPLEGQVCHIGAQTSPALPPRLMVYSQGMWRLVGPSPLQPIVGVPTEIPGQFTADPTTLTTLSVPYPGFPFRLQALFRCEVGVVAGDMNGGRWDTRIIAVQNGSSTQTQLGRDQGRINEITYQVCTEPVNARLFTGDVTLRAEAFKPFSHNVTGQINGGADRVIAAWIHC